jgi:hypothetical protein
MAAAVIERGHQMDLKETFAALLVVMTWVAISAISHSN